jgi:hypothetical protein
MFLGYQSRWRISGRRVIRVIGFADRPAPAGKIGGRHGSIPAVAIPGIESVGIFEVVFGKVPCLGRKEAGLKRTICGEGPAAAAGSLVFHGGEFPQKTEIITGRCSHQSLNVREGKA